MGAKVATTLVAAVGVTVQAPVPAHAPLQPVKTESASGVAVRLRLTPAGKLAAHVMPQSMPAGVEAMIPPPAPILLTVTGTSRRSKFAVTVEAVMSAMVQVEAMPEQPPFHPVKTESASAAATRVMEVPGANAALQVVPQERPAGIEVTVPEPVPVRVTVRESGVGLKVAPTLFAALMVTVQVFAVPMHAPDQPVKVEPVTAAAVSVTMVPSSKVAVQSPVVQSMPAGFELTRPEPVPES